MIVSGFPLKSNFQKRSKLYGSSLSGGSFGKKKSVRTKEGIKRIQYGSPFKFFLWNSMGFFGKFNRVYENYLYNADNPHGYDVIALTETHTDCSNFNDFENLIACGELNARDKSRRSNYVI